MIKLTLHQLDNAIPLVEAGMENHPMGDRLEPSYILAFVSMLVSSGSGAAFIDKVEDPSYGLICTIGKMGITNEKSCFVNVVYAKPDARSASNIKDLQTTIEAYANSEGCDLIRGASLRYKGSDNIDHFWEKMGAEPQELVFIKKLK